MAALKVEWLAELRAGAARRCSRAACRFRTLARLGGAVWRRWSTACFRHDAGASGANRLGVAHQRPLPVFARRPLTRRLHGGGLRARPSAREVVVFADCFAQYQEPEIGEALVRLLRAAGDRVTVADVGCCGRTALSDRADRQGRPAARRRPWRGSTSTPLPAG